MLICGALVVTSACGGSEQQQEEYREAAIVAGIAAAAQVVQTARAQSPDAQNQAQSQGPCCAVCRTCEFPCGDRCVLYGTVCVEPKGCACTDATGAGRDQPVETTPPVGCPTAPTVIVPVP